MFGDAATRYLGAPLELLCGRERGRCERGGEEEELFEHRCRGDALIWELRGDPCGLFSRSAPWVLAFVLRRGRAVLQRRIDAIQLLLRTLYESASVRGRQKSDDAGQKRVFRDKTRQLE